MLRDLYTLAEGNLRRRTAAGAVNIELPETHIAVSGGQVTIAPIGQRGSGADSPARLYSRCPSPM